MHFNVNFENLCFEYVSVTLYMYVMYVLSKCNGNMLLWFISEKIFDFYSCMPSKLLFRNHCSKHCISNKKNNKCLILYTFHN